MYLNNGKNSVSNFSIIYFMCTWNCFDVFYMDVTEGGENIKRNIENEKKNVCAIDNFNLSNFHKFFKQSKNMQFQTFSKNTSFSERKF